MVRLRSFRGLLLITSMTSAALANTLAGKVVDDGTGEALAGVEVRVTRVRASAVLAELETDASGAFALPGSAAGEYQVVFSKANYLPLTLRAESGPVLARLVRLGVISGEVRDAQAQPLARARVVAIAKPKEGEAFRPEVHAEAGYEAQVDARGGYRLYHLAPGEYAVALLYGASGRAVGATGHPETSSTAGSGVLFYPANSPSGFSRLWAARNIMM